MKVSYGRYVVSPWGSVYKQRIAVTQREYDAICDAILSERALNYPNMKKYSWATTPYEVSYTLTPLKLEHAIGEKNPIAFLKITHARFLLKYPELKDRLKLDRNTYIEIVGE